MLPPLPPNLLLRKFNTENFNEKLSCSTTLENNYLLKKMKN